MRPDSSSSDPVPQQPQDPSLDNTLPRFTVLRSETVLDRGPTTSEAATRADALTQTPTCSRRPVCPGLAVSQGMEQPGHGVGAAPRSEQLSESRGKMSNLEPPWDF